MLQRFLLICRLLLAMARRRIWEPLLIVLAIIIATAGLSSVLLINQGASEGELASSQPGWFAGGSITAKKTVSPISKQDYLSLRQAGFTYLVAIAEQTAAISCQSDNTPTFKLTITGVDLTAALSNAGAFDGVSEMAGRQRNSPSANGTSPNADIPTAASANTARYLNCQTVLSGFGNEPLRAPHVVAGLPDERLMMPIDAFYTENRTPQSVPLSALLIARHLTDAEQQTLLKALPAHLKLTVPPTFTSKGTLADSFQLNLWAMGALMTVVSIFIIINALMLMYRARLPTFIRLRQTGVGSQLLLVCLSAELILYCLVAVPSGVFAGSALTVVLTPVLQATFSGLFESVFVAPSPQLTRLILTALIVALVALALFFVIPAKQLIRALSRNRVQRDPLSPAVRLLATMALALLITVTLFLADTTATALISVAVVLLCASVMLILWLAPLLAAVRKLVPPSSPLASYVIASAQMLSGKSRLAVCAFFIALSANIGMNVMTDSFRQATLDWLGLRLTAPAYLYSLKPVDAGILPDTVSVQPVYQAVTTVGGAKVTLRTYPSDNPVQLNLPQVQGMALTPMTFYRGEAVYINQQLAFRLGIKAGEQLKTSAIFTLNSDTQILPGDHAFEVVGVYPDYGNPDMQMIVSESIIGVSAAKRNVAAIYSPGRSLPFNEVARLLPDDVNLLASDELIRRSMETFDRTFVVTDALNVATLLVAGLAFAVSVTLLTMDLKPQLAMLRSLGISQYRIKAALTSQYMLLCAATAAIAVPFGILLAWIFIELVNRYAFFWVYPLSIDMLVLLKSLALSMAVVLIVLLLPLGRLNSKIDLRQEERL